MSKNRAVAICQVPAAHFPAPRQPAGVSTRWHGPPVLVTAGVAMTVAPDRDGLRPRPPGRSLSRA